VNLGGRGTFNSTGTITTLNVDGGHANFARSRAGRTVTNANLYGAAGSIDDSLGQGIVTWTNGVRCLNGASSMQVNFGTNRKVTPAAA
jgi:hypothetical protein